jgi:hypothetical protein
MNTNRSIPELIEFFQRQVELTKEIMEDGVEFENSIRGQANIVRISAIEAQRLVDVLIGASAVAKRLDRIERSS